MRISDWSSDVCSSDLKRKASRHREARTRTRPHRPSCRISAPYRRCSSVFQCPGGDLYVAPQGLHGLEAQARQHPPVVLDIEVEQYVTAARAAISVAVARDGGGGQPPVALQFRWAG